MSYGQIFLALLVSGLLGFGGLGSLPILREQLAPLGGSTDALILNGLAVGAISPGPNGLYLVAIGYFVAGLRGALIAVGATLIPPLLVFVLDHAHTRLAHLHRFRSMLTSLACAVAALVASSSIPLGWQVLGSWVDVVALLSGFVLLLRGAPPALVILGSLGFGLLFG
jgi:chromate transporter